jgi:hypothetical protein
VVLSASPDSDECPIPQITQKISYEERAESSAAAELSSTKLPISNDEMFKVSEKETLGLKSVIKKIMEIPKISSPLTILEKPTMTIAVLVFLFIFIVVIAYMLRKK